MSLIPKIVHQNCNNVFIRSTGGFWNSFTRFSTESQDITPVVDEVPVSEFEAKRNKSKLKSKHYNELHGLLPADVQNPLFPYQQSVVYRRKLAAQHGISTGINLGISWPTKEELEDLIEYEKISNPLPIHEAVAKKKQLREESRMKVIERQKEIEQKIGKLSGWINELNARQNKKLNEEKAAQEKKDKLIEEVRQQLGYQVSLKDPKFQEMLEQKEKEMKKSSKEAKKKTKQEKMISQLTYTGPQETKQES